MKKKRIWIAITIAALGVLAFMVFIQNSSVDHGGEQASNKVTKTDLKELPSQKPKAATDGGSKGEKAEKGMHERPDEEQLSPRVKKMLNLAKMQLADVKFFGRIVDQYNMPVAGVVVGYSVRPAAFGFGGGSGETITNSDGDFEVSGIEGTGVTILKMNKSGYQIALAGQSRYFYNRSEVESRLRWEDCAQETPCIFKAWKYDKDYVEGQKFIKKQFVGSMLSDGTPYSLDLFSYGLNKFSGDLNQGELLFSFNQVSGVWQLKIESRAGGLVKAKGIYTNEAPKTGYQDSLAINDWRFEERQSIQKRKFFFYLKEKQQYGCVDIELTMKKSGNVIIEGFYTINPSGIRILETFDGGKKFGL